MKPNTLILFITVLACAISCKKDPESPTGSNKVSIGATIPDTVSYLFAKVSTQLNSTGGNSISQHGHCWSFESSPDISDAHSELGSISNPGNFSSDLSALSDNQRYYVRPYFIIQSGTIYGIQKEINTLKRGRPVAITGIASDITISSVNVSGTATFDSGFAITQKGICWDTVANPTLLKSIGYSEAGADTGSIMSSITDLIDNKQYYFCAYATNELGTSYGETKQFMTVVITIPTVSTFDVTEITINSAACGGFVSNNGNGTVSGRGVCWNTTGNPSLTNCINKTQDGTGVGNFTSQMNGLVQGMTYYAVAYATNQKGTSYGEIKQFITVPIVKPTVVISDISDITKISATSGGNVTNAGNGTVSSRGVCWSTNSNPTLTNSHTTDGNGTGVFISNLTNLTPNTLYYVRAYATNEAGTSYDNQLLFTTLPNQVPSIITNSVTNITNTTATCGGNVTSDGGAAVTVRGICWSTSPNPTITDIHTTNGSGTGVFVSILTGLTANTLYYVRAYATNNVGTAYGNELTFTTLLNPILPIVTTTAVTNITQTTATSGGNVTSDGGAIVTVRGVCYSTSSNPTITNSHTTNGSGTGVFVSSLTSLTPATLYYIRAYATNSVGTSYGNEIIFSTLTTETIPTVTTDPVSNITQTTATSGGNVISGGGATVTARGVCWNTSSNPTTANSHTTDGSGTGVFVSNITGLTPNTLYYVRAYATNVVGTAYGNEVTFSTLPNPILPTLTTNSVTDIAPTIATSGGNVTSDGGATVTARGVCWSTSSNPTTTNSHTTDGSGIGAFVSYITGLNANTLYYVRAYATNSVGTAYGNEVSFITLPFSIGQSYGGGIIFYIDGSGQHGLISATTDQGIFQWGCEATLIGTSTAIGTGQANTTAIVIGCVQSGIAARICNDLVLNGYSDWFLPSLDELNQMYLQRIIIGGFSGTYWSSSEASSAAYMAWMKYFDAGTVNPDMKSSSHYVRAIRAF